MSHDTRSGGAGPTDRGPGRSSENRDRDRQSRGFTSLDAIAGQRGVGAFGNVNTRDLSAGFLNALKTRGVTGTIGFGLGNMLAGFAAPNITGPRVGLRGFVPEGGVAAQNFERTQRRSGRRGGTPSLNEIIALIAAQRGNAIAPSGDDPISLALARLR